MEKQLQVSVSFKKLCHFVTASVIFKEWKCLKYKNLQNKKEKFLISTIEFSFRIDIVVVSKKIYVFKDLGDGEGGLLIKKLCKKKL